MLTDTVNTETCLWSANNTKNIGTYHSNNFEHMVVDFHISVSDKSMDYTWNHRNPEENRRNSYARPREYEYEDGNRHFDCTFYKKQNTIKVRIGLISQFPSHTKCSGVVALVVNVLVEPDVDMVEEIVTLAVAETDVVLVVLADVEALLVRLKLIEVVKVVLGVELTELETLVPKKSSGEQVYHCQGQRDMH